MRRWIGALALAAPLVLSAAEGNWFQGSLDQAKAAAAERGTVVVLKFYADW